MKRLLHSIGFALLALMPSFMVSSLEAPRFFLVESLKRVFELPGVAVTRFNALLVVWRTGSLTDAGISTSSLRASSNHFVIGNAVGLPEKVGWLGA